MDNHSRTTARSTLLSSLQNTSWNASEHLVDDRNHQLAKVEIAILATIFVFATVGNLLVLFILLRRRKHNTLMHTFMTNLCFADLVVAFFQVLPQLVWDITDRFMGPDLVCRMVKYLQIVGMFASSYMIVAMTFDRHQAICQPMMTYKKGVTRWNIPVFVAWLTSLIFSLPQIFIFSKRKIESDVYECWAEFIQPWGLKAYVTWVTMMVFVLPTFFIATCQVLIFKEIYHSIYLKSERIAANVIKKAQPMHSKERTHLGVSTALAKTVKMTLVIVLVYVVCWAPFFFVQLWFAWDPNPPKDTSAFVILLLLASLNSCTNPWIYAAFSSSVSRELRLLLCCGYYRLHRTQPRKGSSQEDSCFTGSSTLPKDALY
ncbi:vasopressin V2 receptor [Rhinatrema bivittatum]|uniref:vasopressin V2 receptor n=1 Tax=Rhinatrema bivittatum TaxID=194408 RepID=UPI00112CFF14|nr:vasopressin V2 receptor [Rhinatrema bivittatum]XP_029465403.1 vasopressin V2 receptor [Rhinatrema bivittatum]XP_029465413.1 vasopressin V2 receptor [Rhinatrema bivittatum]